MAFKQRQETTTQNMLKQLIYHVYSFNTSSLSEEIKDKCIAIIQKQIITKIIIRWQESYKTSTWIWKDSRRMVFQTPIRFHSLLSKNEKNGIPFFNNPSFFVVQLFQLEMILFWQQNITPTRRSFISHLKLRVLAYLRIWFWGWSTVAISFPK